MMKLPSVSAVLFLSFPEALRGKEKNILQRIFLVIRITIVNKTRCVSGCIMDKFIRVIDNFNWVTDALDILLVTFVVYRMILLIRGTRAVQLLKGVVVVLIATGLSSYLHLRAMSWLLDKVLTIGLFAIPVVFQPELRRALEQLGRTSFFSRGLQVAGERDLHRLINELAKATQVLAKNRIGALLVIERETGLNDYLESGTAIDALVSAELLVNIFIPKTPLHDGAVVIRNNRILAASCFLPLSESKDISKELGTRHRAAVGMSEQSDAVVIVVSEETGQISLAENGSLTMNLDEKSFREMLHTMLAPPKPQGFTLFGRKAGT
jgi:diadenylate cyclase